MSDTNRVRLAYSGAAEGTYGVWETVPNMQDIQFTNESLKADTSVLRSEVIRADRNSPYVARNDYQVSGDIGFELQWLAYDVLLRRLFFDDAWSTGASETNIADVTPNVAGTLTRLAGDWTSNFAVGMWVKLSHATSANDGLIGRIITLSATVMTLDCVTLTTEAESDDWDVEELSFIENGVTLETFGIEKEYQDLTKIFAHYAGCAINTGGFGWESDGLITGSLGIIGKAEETGSASKGNTAAVANPSLNAIDDIPEFYMNGGITPINHTAFRFDLNNNLRGRKQVGELGPFEMGTGTAEVSGSLTQHFLDTDMIDEYLAFNDVHLAAKIVCASLGTYILELPRVKFSSGQRVCGGRNQDVMAEMAWEAIYDATTVLATIRLHKIAV